MNWLFGKQAQPEERGSFSDRSSHITYNNQTKEKTLNQAAIFEEHEAGASLEAIDITQDPKQLPDDTRFNTAVMGTDRTGSEYPARYRPGE